MAKGFLDGYETYDTSSGHGNARRWRGTFKERMTKDQAREILDDQQQTPYQVLGVDEGASKEAIKKAYRTKINQWHPDRNQHREAEALRMSQAIIAAYTLLKKL